jgi:hypothetical protein
MPNILFFHRKKNLSFPISVPEEARSPNSGAAVEILASFLSFQSLSLS